MKTRNYFFKFRYTEDGVEKTQDFTIENYDLLQFFDAVFNLKNNTFVAQLRNESRWVKKVILSQIFRFMADKKEVLLDLSFDYEGEEVLLYKDLKFNDVDYFLSFERGIFVERAKLIYAKEGAFTNEEIQKLYKEYSSL